MAVRTDRRKGTRGKFFRAGARISLPVYLEAEVQDHLAERAKPRRLGEGSEVGVSEEARRKGLGAQFSQGLLNAARDGRCFFL